MKRSTIAKLAIPLTLAITAGICIGYILFSPNPKEKTGNDETVEERFAIDRIERDGETYAIYSVDGKPVGIERISGCDRSEKNASESPARGTNETPASGYYTETPVSIRDEYIPTDVEVFQTRNETYVVGDAWQVREYLAHNQNSSYQGLFAVSNTKGRSPARLPVIDRRGLDRLRRAQPQGVPSESAMLAHDESDNLFYAIINK